ncbi:hypothetical protein TREES_T100019484 [Tupaia chinensis]|uniref:Uncharacterized protein n=1 Tax=Tupaia chinensis TaxID=246437 RepID=L9KLU0_TUPCH|nr:hypothetical protein TREES_T100019484 [Tupaia chinensis]
MATRDQQLALWDSGFICWEKMMQPGQDGFTDGPSMPLTHVSKAKIIHDSFAQPTPTPCYVWQVLRNTGLNEWTQCPKRCKDFGVTSGKRSKARVCRGGVKDVVEGKAEGEKSQREDALLRLNPGGYHPSATAREEAVGFFQCGVSTRLMKLQRHLVDRARCVAWPSPASWCSFSRIPLVNRTSRPRIPGLGTVTLPSGPTPAQPFTVLWHLRGLSDSSSFNLNILLYVKLFSGP